MGSKKKAGYTLFLQIDKLPSSLNKKLQWGAKFKNVKENKMWDMLIMCECSGRMPQTPLSKVNLTLIRHSHRMLDFDGLVGSMKPVVDALVSCGVLQNDGWGVTGVWNVHQRFRPKSDGPLLEIMVQASPDKRC